MRRHRPASMHSWRGQAAVACPPALRPLCVLLTAPLCQSVVHPPSPPPPLPPPGVQVYVLGGRMLRMWWRNPVMLVSESAQYAFMAIFVGLVYLQ